MTTVIINGDSPAGKQLLDEIRRHPRVARIVDDNSDFTALNRYSYKEFKEKLALSLNERFNAKIEDEMYSHAEFKEKLLDSVNKRLGTNIQL
ncbi:hypothetical protein FACS1894155_09970 [Bacteroidia bacterium]|nr:hypothetical protein FACS1894155_09970 [Bacteroidia bacterium]